MRILYLCQDQGIPIMGRRGCSTHVRETCRALQGAGHEVVVLCSRRGSDQFQDCDLEVVEKAPVQAKKLGYDLRNLWHNIPYYRAAKKLVKERKIEAVYERFSLYGLAGTWLGRRYKLPRIVEVNAFLSVEHQHKIHFLKWARWAEKYIALRAPALTVVSQPLHDSLVGLGVESARITNMPMAVDIDHFCPNRDRGEAIRKKWHLEDRYVIGYVGSLSGWHGIPLLPTITQRLLEFRQDFALFVVGGEQNHLRKYQQKVREMNLENHLIFAGSIPYQQVPDYINAMDVALVPDTNYWTCPTKMFEYQASGVPTVAPEYPAIVHAMNHGEEGMIFPPRNLSEMVDHITYLADKPELREEMGEKARKRVAATHSWQNNMEQILKLFEAMQKGEISISGSLKKQA